jgi:hypothetical protein
MACEHFMQKVLYKEASLLIQERVLHNLEKLVLCDSNLDLILQLIFQEKKN